MDDEVISNGSLIALSDGQAAIVVSQGKVLSVFKEPGEHIFHDPTKPGGIQGFLQDTGRRIAFGGDIQPVTHRIYFLNTKECMGNLFRSSGAVPLYISDESAGINVDIGAEISGVFSYRVTDPERFYRLVTGNIEGRFTRELINQQLTSEILKYLQPALAKLPGMRSSQLTGEVPGLCDAVQNLMSEGWAGAHGLEVTTISINSMHLVESGSIANMQYNSALKDPLMTAGTLTGEEGEAMRHAALTRGGNSATPLNILRREVNASKWYCPSCGTSNIGKFCTMCGIEFPGFPKE